MENPIKVLLKSTCPHCSKDILIEVESPTPIVKSILTEGDIKAAKDFVIQKLNTLFNDGKFDRKDLDSAEEWLNSEDTVFGPKDAEMVADSIINAK